MSRHNGGLGATAMWDVSSVFLQYGEREADVPSALREGKSTYRPLGKYLRKKLRIMVGRDAEIPEEVLAEYEKQVRDVYSRIWNASKAERNGLTVKEAFKAALVEMNAGTVSAMLARAQIFKQGRRL